MNYYIYHVKINTKNNDSKTPLHIASKQNKIDMIKFLIDKEGDYKSIDNNGNTLLHSVCCTNKLDSIKYLINMGLDVNSKNNNGNTPLHISAFSRFDKLSHFY